MDIQVRLVSDITFPELHDIKGLQEGATYYDIYVRLVRNGVLLLEMRDYFYHLFGLKNDRGTGRFHVLATQEVEGGDILVLTPKAGSLHATACGPGECKDDCKETCSCVVPVQPAEPKNNGERDTCFWCSMPTKRVSATICFCPKCKK